MVFLIGYIVGFVMGLVSKLILNTVMVSYSGIGPGTIFNVGDELSGVHRLWLCLCALFVILPLFYVFSSSPFDVTSEDAMRLGILTGFVVIEFRLPIILQYCKSALRGVVVKI